MWDRYKRWRHSRGYGVHSPFAYKFVTDVLRPGPYGYYSYHDIEPNLKGMEIHDYKLIRKIKFVIRLANLLKSRRIISACGSRLGEVASLALRLPSVEGGKENQIFSPRDLYLIEKTTEVPILNDAIEKGASILALNPTKSIRSILERKLPYGLLLAGSHSVILIPRPEMAYTSYLISIKFR